MFSDDKMFFNAFGRAEKQCCLLEGCVKSKNVSICLKHLWGYFLLYRLPGPALKNILIISDMLPQTKTFALCVKRNELR